MAKKKKKNPIVLSKENLLYQPLPLALSGYEATAMQQNIVIAILRKMRSAIKEMRDNQYKQDAQQLSLFMTDSVINSFLKDGDLCFDVHMRELGVEAKHYPVAFNSIYNMSDAIVYVPVEKDGKQQMLRTKLFDTIDDNVEKVIDRAGRVTYRYKARTPVCSVVMRKPVAEFLFPSDKRIYDFLDETALSISEKYPKRIYMYLSNFKHIPGGVYIVDYWKFRHDIGLNDEEAELNKDTDEQNIKYPFFRNFVQKALGPAERILKKMADQGDADFSFDVEPIYKGKRRTKNPDSLKFTFHLSEVGQRIQEEKRGMKKDIELERMLMEDLDQSANQVAVLIKLVTDETRFAFVKKVKALKSELKRVRKTPIGDIRSWANASLSRFLEEEMEKADLEANLDLFPTQQDVEKKGTSLPVDSIDSEMWERFLLALRDGVGESEFHTWFKDVIQPVAFKDGNLEVEAPTRFVAERYVNEYRETFTKAVADVFGDDVRFRVKIKD